jgi:hypothetical protein
MDHLSRHWKRNRQDTLAFGLEVPAKPAFNVAVPLSMTTGWLRSNELPEASPVVSSDAIFGDFSSVHNQQ